MYYVRIFSSSYILISISKPIASGTVSNKYFELKNGEYRDGIKSKETALPRGLEAKFHTEE